jgi:hypothetical protein
MMGTSGAHALVEEDVAPGRVDLIPQVAIFVGAEAQNIEM